MSRTERHKSNWELLSGMWQWLCYLNSRRREAALRQRNMLAGVVIVVLVDLLCLVAGTMR